MAHRVVAQVFVDEKLLNEELKVAGEKVPALKNVQSIHIRDSGKLVADLETPIGTIEAQIEIGVSDNR